MADLSTDVRYIKGVGEQKAKALEKLGLSYEALREECPGLIYVHFGAFGQKGPEKDFPGFDIASFWAKSGTLV